MSERKRTTVPRPDHNSGVKLWMVVLLTVLFAVVPNAIAQENPVVPGADQPEAAASAPDIEPTPDTVPGFPRTNGPLAPVGPDTFILLDTNGRPQPVLGMTYEDFIEAWKKLRQLDEESREPTYILESLHAEGRVEGETAVLNVRFEIELKAEGLVELPLGFKDAILSDLKDSDPAVQLSYDETRGGYIAWVRSTGKTAVVHLPLLVPLKRDGNKHLLQMNVPRALVNQLQLDAPARIAAPAVTEGAVVQLADRGNLGSRLTVTGLVGDIALSWSTPGSEAPTLETVLSVAGQITTSVDGRSARSEARLRVESFGGQFQQFRLRLPPGAQLVLEGATEAPESQPGYKLRPEDTSSPPADDNGEAQRQIWVVETAEPTSGPVDVRLVTEQAIGLSRANTATELAGFEVLGAVRQFGELALRVDPNWQLRWNQIDGGRQVNVDALDQESAADPALFGFEYYQQPWSLPVQVQPRGTRVAVSSKYRLELLPDEARLKVTLQYQLAGSQEMRFRVKLAGWEVTADPIEPTRLIDADNVLVTRDLVLDDDVLELPLTQAASRRTEITFHARRSLTSHGSKLELPLPMPLADSIGTGELTVLAHPSLLVVPSSTQEGLAPLLRTGDVETTLDGGLDPIAAYRSLLGNYQDRLVFAAEVNPRAGEVVATVESHVGVSRQLTHVQHTLSFDAKYRPVSEIDLSMPSELMRDASFRLALLPGDGAADDNGLETDRAPEGMPLQFQAAEIDDQPDASEPPQVIAVALPQPQLGRFRVRATYTRPSEVARDGTLAPSVVPLPMPVQMPVTSQLAIVSVREIEQLELAPTERDLLWSATPPIGSSAIGETVLKAKEPTSELPLSFRPVQSSDEGRTVVDQVWHQSWCAANARQQRVVYRLRSNAPQVTVELPLGIAGREVEVAIDGAPTINFERREAQIVVPLTATDEMAAHTLELRYLESTPLGPWDQLQIEFPQIGGEATLAELYWQVIVPKNYWIVRRPSTLAQAHVWAWSAGGLRPAPVKSTRDLAGIGGVRDLREPDSGEAEYLFSGFGPRPMLTATVARGEIIHLIVAGMVLAVGFGLLYVPALRRLPVMFGAAVALLFVGAAYPDWLLICAPALAIGAALALLACLLFALVPRRPIAETTGPASTAHGTFISSRENYLASPIAAASSNAPTITLRPSESNV
ncbi:MAG: hypothetical protein WD851_02260 [Pirellulales bacterium]